jgi:CHAT domain-containing protein
MSGAAATEARLDSLAATGSIARFDVLHLATHALPYGSFDRFAFELAPGPRRTGAMDGRLSVREIVHGWRTNARIVALSACKSGFGAGLGSDEPIGFQDVFLAIGARSVVTCIWPIDDEAGLLFMRRFFDNVRVRELGPAEAVRDAQKYLREYRAPDGSQPFEHPVYWAGFAVTGVPE